MTTTPTPPEGPHVDLIAELRESLNLIGDGDWTPQDTLARRALAALSDSVPREWVLSLEDVDSYYVKEGIHTYSEVLHLMEQSDTELDEALAVIEQVRALRDNVFPGAVQRRLDVALEQAPADALARLKAEAGAQALDDAATDLERCTSDKSPSDRLRSYAATLREGAGS